MKQIYRFYISAKEIYILIHTNSKVLHIVCQAFHNLKKYFSIYVQNKIRNKFCHLMKITQCRLRHFLFCNDFKMQQPAGFAGC